MARSLRRVRSLEDLAPNPLVYDRAAFMEHVRRYDREALREHYLRQPVEGAYVWANYAVNLWEYEHGVEQLTSYPWNVTIPVTEICNATCAFCSSPLVPDPKALAVDEVAHFAEALRHAVRVSLQGLGEPLAHPHFEEIAAEIRKYLSPVAELEIITNGWLLSGHRWELLKSLRVKHVQISVNAGTDRTHQVAMGSRPGTFDRVLQNIQHVLGDPTWQGLLKASMVITRHSLPEVPQFLSVLAEAGVRRCQFNALLPITGADWGFGRTDQYRDLWCGHLPNAAELVDRAAGAIVEYRGKGMLITADPDQWLAPVHSSRAPDLIQLTTDGQRTIGPQPPSLQTARSADWDALSVWVDRTRLALVPHDTHAEITSSDVREARFRGTDESCRWAYLLRTPGVRLSAGEYVLSLDMNLHAGTLFGGILDVAHDEFVTQSELRTGKSRISFQLAEERTVQIVIRQGDSDTLPDATFERGELALRNTVDSVAPQATGAAEDVRSSERSSGGASPPTASDARTSGGEGTESSTAKRIYCPMVYTTLSVFHHSLDVSICCYMENVPGRKRPNIRSLPLLRAYNDDGFTLVRRTLSGDRHLRVCETCEYGPFRS